MNEQQELAEFEMLGFNTYKCPLCMESHQSGEAHKCPEDIENAYVEWHTTRFTKMEE